MASAEFELRARERSASSPASDACMSLPESPYTTTYVSLGPESTHEPRALYKTALPLWRAVPRETIARAWGAPSEWGVGDLPRTSPVTRRGGAGQWRRLRPEAASAPC